MTDRPPETSQLLPWYRYPWPWVAIAIPGAAVIGGLITLYLAVSNPDPLVVDEQRYEQLRSELHADPSEAPATGASAGTSGAIQDELERDD